MKKYKEFITEATLKRLSDSELSASIQKLIDKKTVRIIKEDGIFKIKWNDANDAIFLANNPKNTPKSWETGLKEVVDGKGFAITVWDGIPKELKKAIQAANTERRARNFDKDESLRSKS